MYLSRLTLNHSRTAIQWLSNPYRVHQRLKMACDHDPRLLFRIEESDRGVQILVQSVNAPDWQKAFGDFPVLAVHPESKPFTLALQAGKQYRFRLLANPTVKQSVEKDGEGPRKTRHGLTKEADQAAWLRRKLEAAGAEVLTCQAAPRGRQVSRKSSTSAQGQQTHLAVLFEGQLLAKDPALLETALAQGIGSAKGYGFGLLSLGPAGQ